MRQAETVVAGVSRGDLVSTLQVEIHCGRCWRLSGMPRRTRSSRPSGRVTFRLEGVIDVPLAPIVMTGSEDKVVATARGVLIR